MKTSVIIIAHNRKNFVLNALKSIIKQIEKPDEIYLIKNFKDEEIDIFCENNKISNIIIDEDKGGGLYAKGIKESDSEIIAFLDDDDMFFLNKIQHVKKIFNNYNDIGFYHNNRSLINEVNEEINCNNVGFVKYLCGKNLEQKVYINNKNKINALNIITKTGEGLKDPFYWLGFNSSSMTIRREIVIPYIDILKNLYFAQDMFYFLLALIHESSIIHEPALLTKYRVHASQFSYVNSLNKEQTVYKLIEKSSKSLNDLNILEKFINEHNINQINLKETELFDVYALSTYYSIKKDINGLKEILNSNKLSLKRKFLIKLLISSSKTPKIYKFVLSTYLKYVYGIDNLVDEPTMKY